MGNEIFQFHLNSVASPRSPGLNFFVVHQRTAGLPSAIHKGFAFCLLPSRQPAILCHQMDQVPVCGMRRSRFREGKSHGLFLNIHTCKNPVLWPCSAAKNVKFEEASFDNPRTPKARFRVQLQWPWRNDLGFPLSWMWGRSKGLYKRMCFLEVFEPVECIFNTKYSQRLKLGVESMVGVVVLAAHTWYLSDTKALPLDASFCFIAWKCDSLFLLSGGLLCI